MPDWRTDKEFANLLCNEDEYAKKYFQKEYLKILLWVSKKLDPWKDSDNYKYWINTDNQGKVKLRIPDDTMDAYMFLGKYAIRESCKYKGRSGCTFKTYITGILNGRFCRLEYIRSKKGDYSYVPKCIKVLGEQYGELLGGLRRNKNRDVICRQLNIDENEYKRIKDKIYSNLVSHGMLSIIENPNVDITKYIDDDFQKPEPVETHAIGLGDIQTNNEILEYIKILTSNMDKYEKILLSHYWGGSLGQFNDPLNTVNKLFEAWSFKPELKNILDSLEIKKPKHIYSAVTRITNNLSNKFSQDFPAICEQYSLNRDKVKTILKIYFKDFIKNDKKNISSAPN